MEVQTEENLLPAGEHSLMCSCSCVL